ncbi:MAG: DNA N-6-adenine-methyltransferase [Clostridia bacterium]
MSSSSDEWSTPQYLFDILNRIDIDVCATKYNAKCPLYYTREQGARSQIWEGTVWMNPPYGREIGKWMRKAMKASEIRLISGRLKFGDCKTSAPFPSAIVIFGTQDWEVPYFSMMEAKGCSR